MLWWSKRQSPTQELLEFVRVLDKEGFSARAGNADVGAQKVLREAEAVISARAQKPKTSFSGVRAGAVGSLSAAVLTRMERMYWRVAEMAGPGAEDAERTLLSMLAYNVSVDREAFWQEVLTQEARPRDRLAKRRRVLAAAALTLLAVRTSDVTRLDPALHATDAGAQTEAMAGLGMFVSLVAGPKSGSAAARSAAVDRLRERATAAGSGAGRILARRLLLNLREPVPVDAAAGAYRFRVKKQGHRGFSCKLDLRADATLQDLHFGILSVVDWEDDHMHAVYFPPNSEPFVIGSPADSEDRYSDDDADWVSARSLDETEGESLVAPRQLQLAELGLLPAQTLLYRFDFGDDHRFDVTVEAVLPASASDGARCSIHAVRGELPVQYEYY